MNYQEAVDWIHGQNGLGIKNGVENERALLAGLGNPHLAYPCVHVAGTNGKGSTSALLASALQAAGMRVGLYTSPFLFHFNDRMRVNGRDIPDDTFAEIATRVRGIAEELRASGIVATVFELGTACAFEYFARENVDIAVVEVGLGGRLDSTNVITPAVSVITHIGLDHTKQLGDTPPQIAWEKAGIVKSGVPCVLYPQSEAVAAVVRGVCTRERAMFIGGHSAKLSDVESDRTGHRFSVKSEDASIEDIRINLPGDYQLDNARTALLALFALRRQGFAISDEAIRAGFARARWPGRLDWRGNMLFDGAHNPQGAQMLAAYVKKWCAGKKLTAICGIIRGKDMDGIVGAMADMVDAAICVPIESHRETSAQEIQAIFARYGVSADAAPSVRDALAMASRDEDAVTVVFGSLYLVGEALSIIGGQYDELFV